MPEVDHINANKADNTVFNLRWVTHKGNYENENTRKLLSDINKGKKWREKDYKVHCKPILLYKGNRLIKKYESIIELVKCSQAEYGVELYSTYIHKVLNGNMSEYHDFSFKYA